MADDNADDSDDNVTYVRFESADGQLINVPKDVAMNIQFVKSIMEDTRPTEGMIIPMDKIDSCILERVIRFCTFLNDAKEEKLGPAEVSRFEREFFNVDNSTLFHIIAAANFLDIERLLDQACKNVASRIKDKTTEQIREAFEIENDFKPEELEQIRRDNAWFHDR